ncbi:NADH:flavin oxidoreductase [Candidatus Dependentiae bacterium]|nr:NADH:flavin oxidoreductase [Candidatus Dependentiae bacterium]
MKLFEESKLGTLTLKNRIIRSATFEGMCDAQGFPTEAYKELYTELSRNEIGAIITGFAYIAPDGRAMQPGQAGIDSREKVKFFKEITDQVHNNDCKIIMQIAHTGRQTLSSSTGYSVKGVSNKKSPYFNQTPKVLTTEEIKALAEKFGESSLYAKDSGFDGVQIHAAHGYLIHQFILPSINDRDDIFKIDYELKIGIGFLDLVIDKIRENCGWDFPILIKVSGSDDYKEQFSTKQFINLIKFLDTKKVTGIEISYGTMDHALNIFRCSKIPIDIILKFNQKYKIKNKTLRAVWKYFFYGFASRKVIKYSPAYNLKYSILAKAYTDIPIISVGGFRTGTEINNALNEVDFISLSRPFIVEPDYIKKIKADINYKSKCINCSKCAIMSDTNESLRCYSNFNNSELL